LCNPENGDGGADTKSNFRGAKAALPASALRHIRERRSPEADVSVSRFRLFPEIHNDLLLLACRILANDYGLILRAVGVSPPAEREALSVES